MSHGLFEIAVILKGLNGIGELAAAVTLLLISPQAVIGWVTLMAHQELSPNKADPLTSMLQHWGASLGHHEQVVGAAYLLFHGVVKTTLATLLLLGYRQAYPIAIVFFTAFVTYAGYRLSQHWSWPLGCLVTLDVFTVLIIAREWWVEVRART
jgi:uncharacterized membrane protein